MFRILTISLLLVTATPAFAADNPLTHGKLSRCNLPANLVLLFQKHADVVTDAERLRLAGYDKVSQMNASLAAAAGKSAYCGLIKKLIPRIEATERAARY